ncbi:hypothetical protein PYCCODRAFT_1205761 [Trametes coccinea BRFM310]|uniref:Uncharacterized protein n=1 Tax=Trametes coccinea (strain BRFM310) TaxID=1353009 RepID=A0A1Y2I754_TRAC3|nr:hypothetical protein PYCCODRAFT_1205761 [Trametes coccinea BRFM310]
MWQNPHRMQQQSRLRSEAIALLQVLYRVPTPAFGPPSPSPSPSPAFCDVPPAECSGLPIMGAGNRVRLCSSFGDLASTRLYGGCSAHAPSGHGEASMTSLRMPERGTRRSVRQFLCVLRSSSKTRRTCPKPLSVGAWSTAIARLDVPRRALRVVICQMTTTVICRNHRRADLRSRDVIRHRPSTTATASRVPQDLLLCSAAIKYSFEYQVRHRFGAARMYRTCGCPAGDAHEVHEPEHDRHQGVTYSQPPAANGGDRGDAQHAARRGVEHPSRRAAEAEARHRSRRKRTAVAGELRALGRRWRHTAIRI